MKKQIIVPSIGRIVIVKVTDKKSGLPLSFPAVVVSVDEKLNPSAMNFCDFDSPLTLVEVHMFGVSCNVSHAFVRYGEEAGGVGSEPVWSWPVYPPPGSRDVYHSPESLGSQIQAEKRLMG